MLIPGRVAEPPRAGYHPASGSYVLHVLVINERSDKPYHADRNYGPGPSASIAAEKEAMALRTGTPVVLHCEGLQDQRYLGAWVRHAVHCSLIEHHATPPRSEATSQADAA